MVSSFLQLKAPGNASDMHVLLLRKLKFPLFKPKHILGLDRILQLKWTLKQLLDTHMRSLENNIKIIHKSLIVKLNTIQQNEQ